METLHSVKWFINKFEAIPEEKWHIGDYTSSDGNKHCAYGHCGFGLFERSSPEGKALSAISRKWLGSSHYLAKINDGSFEAYQQPTPKQRILAALYDIKNMQEREDITKSLAILPVEERVDKIENKIMQL